MFSLHALHETTLKRGRGETKNFSSFWENLFHPIHSFPRNINILNRKSNRVFDTRVLFKLLQKIFEDTVRIARQTDSLER